MAPQPEEIDYQVGSSSTSMLVTADVVKKKPIIYWDKEGVYVVASTLAELEGVLECFKSTGLKVPVNAMNIDPAVTKDDVVVASLMLDNKKEYAAICAVNVEVTPEALDYANQVGVKIDSCFETSDFFPQAKAFLQNI